MFDEYSHAQPFVLVGIIYVSFTKYDTSDVPYNFVLSGGAVTTIDQTLEKLEKIQFTQ